MAFKTAVRANVPIKIALEGPSGAGKTFSSLLLAYGLCGAWESVFLIDTENGSGNYYAHLGPYQSDTMTVFSPQNYIKLIHEAERAGGKVIVIDSLSHAWSGTGGILDIKDKKQGGNSFTNWASITPLHNNLIDAILQSPCDVIVTMRTKTDYVMEDDVNSSGRTVTKVRKVGTKAIQRDGVEYEYTIVFDINHAHLAEASKDRTGLYADGQMFKLGIEHGVQIREWRDKGAIIVPQQVEEEQQRPPTTQPAPRPAPQQSQPQPPLDTREQPPTDDKPTPAMLAGALKLVVELTKLTEGKEVTQADAEGLMRMRFHEIYGKPMTQATRTDIASFHNTLTQERRNQTRQN